MPSIYGNHPLHAPNDWTAQASTAQRAAELESLLTYHLSEWAKASAFEPYKKSHQEAVWLIMKCFNEAGATIARNALVTLNLSAHGLHSLPEAIRYFEQLNALYCRGNEGLKKLPESIAKLPALYLLDCSGNSL